MTKIDKLDDYMAQLKEAAELIENPKTSLDAAIVAYQKGAAAYAECVAILQKCEQKINHISKALEKDAADES